MDDSADLIVWILRPGGGIEHPFWDNRMDADIAVNNLGDSKVHSCKHRALLCSLDDVCQKL